MQGITEQKTKAYFLGDLADDDAFAFEMETAASAQLTDFVRAVETALVDDFVAGRLSASAAEKFTRVYLTTPARLERCRMAAGLRQLVAEQSIETPVAPPIANWFEHNVLSRKKFVTFLVGLALLISLGLAIWVSVVRSKDAESVAGLTDVGVALPVADAVPEDKTVALSVDSENEAAIPEAAFEKTVRSYAKKESKPRKIIRSTAKVNSKEVSVPRSPSRSMVVKLMPGRSRGSATQSVTIAPDVDCVLVMLSPGGDPNKYRSLHAVVKTPEDKTVFSTPELNSLSFMIDASRLENRTYVVTLEGKNGESRVEKIANYTFMIRR